MVIIKVDRIRRVAVFKIMEGVADPESTSKVSSKSIIGGRKMI